MEDSYKTDHPLSRSDGGKDEEEPAESKRYSDSLPDLTEEEVREGVLQDCHEEQSPSAPGPGRRGGALRRKVTSLCTAVRRSWFLKETVLLLRLSIPTVRYIASSNQIYLGSPTQKYQCVQK